MTQFSYRTVVHCALFVALIISNHPLEAADNNSTPYIQDFTAYTLKKHQVKIGLSTDLGITDNIQIGTDTLATIAGAPNLKLKLQVFDTPSQKISVGVQGTYLDRETALWGDISSMFTQLDAKLIRPQISWSHRISRRLNIHSHWSIGIGNISATLSDKGRKALWDSKYPDGDYETGQKTSDEATENQEANFSQSQRTLQVQALLGLSRDLFQVTGEFIRDETKKVLLTSRIEVTNLEGLSAQGFRITAGQEWKLDSFNFRLGLGMLYQVLTGEDLDGEKVDDSGFTPIGDLDFYWVF